MANVPLQVRAGMNIGIEKGSVPFLQDAGSREIAINPVVGSEVVILECPQGMARSLRTLGAADGMIFNKTTSEVFYRVLFQDTLGNRLPVSPDASVLGGDATGFEYGVASETTLILNPGEKIILETVAAPPPPP